MSEGTFYDESSQNTTAWLSTTASQIFFMQLGFLCYEVGFVKPVWTQSVILKNIEDTFVGVLTFLAFGFTLSESPKTFYGIISIPTQPFLIGVNPEMHDQILISAFFASTCATIISGAVLERMKNKAYITWCLLIILINYSFVSHWVWHKTGWLNAMGFVDGAGSVVVHSTAGMAGLVAVWKLGPRRDSLDADGNLLPTEHAARPVINAIGAFFLWYGWFAFNVSSPIAFSKGIGDAIGTTALVTVISPICSSCAAFIWMWAGFVQLSFESLLSCLLCGLVAITGMCHTCDVWEAAIIGFLSSIVYFASISLVRNKMKLDDPLQVIAIHLFCGAYSGMAEGVVANDVYGTPGIIRGGVKGFSHFGVQVLGVVVITVFNFVVATFLYEVVVRRLVFGNIDIRVSILDIYLGTRLFDQNYDMALDEVLNCNSNVSKQMLWEFHKYIGDRYASEQLDFLIVTKIYGHYLARTEIENIDKSDPYRSAKYILRIVNTYVDENGTQCINVSGTQRSVLMRIKHQLLFEIKMDRIAQHKQETAREKQATAVHQEEEEEPLQVTVVTEDAAKDEDYKSLDIMWKDNNDAPVPDKKKKKPKKDKYLTKFELYQSGLDITRENVFKSVYSSVWKLVVPHFTHFLQNAYDIERQPKFDIKIPFKLEKNWIIQWDEVLQKQRETIELADTVPRYKNSGTLLSKMLKEYDDSNGRVTPVFGQPKRRRSSGLEEIQLTEKHVEEGEEPPNKESDNVGVIIE
eukprot:86988_1